MKLPSDHLTSFCRFQRWLLYFSKYNNRYRQVRGRVETGIDKYPLKLSMGSSQAGKGLSALSHLYNQVPEHVSVPNILLL